ncbi:uncharacterized protein CCR75_003142 [Bremia lactucae]|uniref:Uncharacterized protein n=1 Tax=Bremia lactucae TaxID=4779 RepID=A0A976FII0_BRELC|nr:hypothetical protein CCR75_004540 [Bremia lactucae]TDH71947.1 hypothetical protein CCR75_003142 [Bremia lactucae]
MFSLPGTLPPLGTSSLYLAYPVTVDGTKTARVTKPSIERTIVLNTEAFSENSKMPLENTRIRHFTLPCAFTKSLQRITFSSSSWGALS